LGDRRQRDRGSSRIRAAALSRTFRNPRIRELVRGLVADAHRRGHRGTRAALVGGPEALELRPPRVGCRQARRRTGGHGRPQRRLNLLQRQQVDQLDPRGVEALVGALDGNAVPAVERAAGAAVPVG
jgi:hypothetical protein